MTNLTFMELRRRRQTNKNLLLHVIYFVIKKIFIYLERFTIILDKYIKQRLTVTDQHEI